MKQDSHVVGKPRNLLLYAIFSVSGLTFWFFLGFPFANHNESYGWITQMHQMPDDFLTLLQWSPASSYRPLGSITAWIGFTLSNGSIYPQQIFNFLIAILAWMILFFTFSEKKLFSFIAFIVGGVFFSGYIYLFHLHGVFYSPLLVFIAILIAISIHDGFKSNSMILLIFGLMVLTSLYHTFTVLIYIAFILGYYLEIRSTATRIQWMIGALILITALILMKTLVPEQDSFLPSRWLHGLYTSYRLAELKTSFFIISLLLSIITVLSLDTSRHIKLITGIVITASSFVLVLLDQPVLILWIAICLVKTILLKKWSLAFLLISTAVLPVAAATGSPTYTVFVIMVCSAIVPFRWSPSALESTTYNKIVFSTLILMGTVGVLLKSNVYLPVISKLVNPILAEKEKTFQLENIIQWWYASDYTKYRLVLCQPADNPVVSNNVINRKHRAPTSQDYLDIYTNSLMHLRRDCVAGQLLICFGDEKVSDAELLRTFPGRYNGPAIIYLKKKNTYKSIPKIAPPSYKK